MPEPEPPGASGDEHRDEPDQCRREGDGEQHDADGADDAPPGRGLVQAQTVGLALLVVRDLFVGPHDMRALGVAEPPLVEGTLGEPAHRRTVFLVDDDGLGAEPAPVGESDEQGEEEAQERAAQRNPADHLGDDRDDL